MTSQPLDALRGSERHHPENIIWADCFSPQRTLQASKGARSNTSAVGYVELSSSSVSVLAEARSGFEHVFVYPETFFHIRKNVVREESRDNSIA